MQTIKLEIEDSKVDIVLNIIENLKSNVISKYEVISQNQTRNNNYNSYTNAKEYSEYKTYFQESLNEIENGDSKLIPFSEGLDDIDKYIESL